MARASACAREEDCGVDLRGEQYYGLDGCFRMRNLHAPTVEADRIAQQWLDERCVERYEVCSVQPLAACRQGRCVARPPPPIPADWVRRDFARYFTFFTPPDVEVFEMGVDCGFARLGALGRKGDFMIQLLFDEGSAEPPDGEWQESLAKAERMQLGQLSARVMRGKRNAMHRIHPEFEYGIGVYIDPGACPPICFPWSDRPGRLELHASCRDRAACDEAMRVIQSLRPW
jgi:hypothetical protein